MGPSLVFVLAAVRLAGGYWAPAAVPVPRSPRRAASAGAALSRARTSAFGRRGGLASCVAEAPLDVRSSSSSCCCCCCCERFAARRREDESPFDQFVRQFVGHFDNRVQALADRVAGMPPREGGGHEHILCHLQPLALHGDASRTEGGAATRLVAVLATYHFAGSSPRPFRQRVYEMRPLHASHGAGLGAEAVEMRIYRLLPEAEARLSASGGAAPAVEWDAARDLSADLVIPGCDVVWTFHGDGFEGEMRTESAVVHSPILHADIVVRDALSLSDDHLWVNDRGWDLQGKYLYGNIHDVPYKMDRVARPSSDSAWA